MKLIIDDAHIDLIKKIYEYYPVDGVTTNPSILAKSGRQPFEVLKEIRSFIGEEAELHVQVVAKDADGMVDDAHRIVKELGANTYVKVPSIPEGFKAMKISTLLLLLSILQCRLILLQNAVHPTQLHM